MAVRIMTMIVLSSGGGRVRVDVCAVGGRGGAKIA